MLASLMVTAADGITIQFGDQSWFLDFGFLIYLAIAAIVGLIAEYIVGWRLPLGIIGAIIAALVGIWLMTSVVQISGIGDVNIQGVPIFRALIGAIALTALWHLLTYGLTRRRYHTA